MSYEEIIEKIIADPASMRLPANAPLIAKYLSSWRPAMSTGDNEDHMTSLSIAEAFDDICPVSCQDVSAVMLALGYRLECGYHTGLRWAMVRSERMNDDRQ